MRDQASFLWSLLQVIKRGLKICQGSTRNSLSTSLGRVKVHVHSTLLRPTRGITLGILLLLLVYSLDSLTYQVSYPWRSLYRQYRRLEISAAKLMDSRNSWKIIMKWKLFALTEGKWRNEAEMKMTDRFFICYCAKRGIDASSTGISSKFKKMRAILCKFWKITPLQRHSQFHDMLFLSLVFH